MTPPRLIVRYFEGSASGTWTRLVRALAYSASQHCPNWTQDIADMGELLPLNSPLGVKGYVSNTYKLDAWTDAVKAAAPGERLLLLDADTLIRAPLDDVWDLPFDFAYTTKPSEARHPFNAGVIFLRVSPATQAFLATWRRENRRMLDDPLYHQVWRPAFGGINQSALGMLLKQGRHGLDVRRLPCREWNLENEHWQQFDPARTRIVHFKDELQRALFGGGMESRTHAPLIAEWRAAEDAAAAAPDGTTDTRPEQTTQVVPADLTIPERSVPLSRRARRALRRPQEGVA